MRYRNAVLSLIIIKVILIALLLTILLFITSVETKAQRIRPGVKRGNYPRMSRRNDTNKRAVSLTPIPVLRSLIIPVFSK
jgi:hypothetical protein